MGYGNMVGRVVKLSICGVVQATSVLFCFIFQFLRVSVHQHLNVSEQFAFQRDQAPAKLLHFVR